MMQFARKVYTRRKSIARAPASKRLKLSIKEDRISALPEALIIHILSFLPTKDSIRTGVLSRRWQYLWTHVPKLYFGLDDDDADDTDEFIKCVNRTLILCSDSKFKDFGVSLAYYESCYDSDVSVWTRFAVKNGVEKFVLELAPDDDDCYTLPQFLYQNLSFRELRFRHCNVFPRGPISWKSLKRLSISLGILSDDALQKILAGSPALEILGLCLVRGNYDLQFGNSGVKELIVKIDEEPVDSEPEESMLVISAPNVHSLKISGHFQTCRLVDMTSLVEATLFGVDSYPTKYPSFTRELLYSVSNVQTLKVDDWVIQGIQTLPDNDVLPSLAKCKCLTVNTYLWERNPCAIDSLLKITPEIEALTVNIANGLDQLLERTPSQYDISNLDQYWTSQEAASSYLTHLRTVKFNNFWFYSIPAFSFVPFLLKNAKVLRKMIIDLGITSSSRRELSETAQKILSIPRSSPDAELFITSTTTEMAR